MASRRADIAPMVEQILHTVEPAGFDVEQKDNLAVALAEALSNAAVHGNKLHPRSRVAVKISLTPDAEATVTVTDTGAGFDVNSVPDPSTPEKLLEPNGRGVFLMRALVDGVDYNDKGNEVRLTVRRKR